MPDPNATPGPLPPPPPQIVAAAHDHASQTAADAAIDHAADAKAANQAAAKHTAEAAKNAKTEAARREVTQSAAAVSDRETKIAQALANLGAGECGVRSYPHVTETVKDALLARLRAEGMEVTGNNPWNIETHQYDVRLRAVWDPKTSTLKLIVTSKGLGWCAIIWDRIEPKLKEIIK